MGADRPDFGRRTRSAQGPKLRVMAGLLSVVSLATWWVYRTDDPPPPDDGHDRLVDELVVEVRGAVPTPGFHAVGLPVTVAAALAAAGVPEVTDDRPVPPGSRIDFDGEIAQLSAMEDTLVVGLPLDLNAATSAALQALPGVGPARAEAIVAERSSHGPFTTVDELVRVKGIGPKTVDELRPFVEVAPTVP